ncbi:TPA: alpha/beta hydrolase [Pseudomonas putida]
MATPLYKHFTTREQLDAEYDIEASVADFDGYVQQFVDNSRAVREGIPNQLDLPYGPTLDETFDLFFPPQTSTGELRPAVYFVHGGYWRATTSKEWSYVAKGLSDLGIVTVVENYTLAPKASIAEIVRQHRAGFSYVWRNAERFGIDRERIVLVGHSAGAHGVVELLATDWVADYGLPAQPYRGAVAVSGVYDLRPLPHTFLVPTLDFTWQSAEALSPILHIPAQLPPLLLPYGLRETAEFRRQTTDYALACSERGLAVEVLALDLDHFNILDDLAASSGPMVQRIREWLAAG